jgi:chloramphenicol-sensitive protein RarD
MLPLYLKALHGVAPLEIVLHRIVWLLGFLGAVLYGTGKWRVLRDALRQRGVPLRSGVSALLLSVNWLVYVWAVDRDRVVDASLGYFIHPLVNVLLGMLVLRERLRAVQWVSIGIATLGVLWLAIGLGEPPWIGLTLAGTFGAYGLLRKTAALGSLEGLALETLLLFPPALGVLVWWAVSGRAAFTDAGWEVVLLLVLAGPATGVPLLLFASGARRIPLSLLGVLQYIGPSVQLLLGLLVWQEAFPPAKALGFSVIWAALALYALEGAVTARARYAALPPGTVQR